MKKIILFLLIATAGFSSSISAAAEIEQELDSEVFVETYTYGNIDAPGLKILIDSQIPFVLLDARGTWWKDPNTLPGAQFASYEYSAEDLDSLIPYAESLIVVYCYSSTCPLADKLANHLFELGYSHVIKYPGGLSEWRDIMGYPVDTAYID